MDVHIDELLREYDDFVASNSRVAVVNSKGRAWVSTLLKELRKSKIRRPDIVCELGPSLISFENYVDVWNLREQIAVASLEEGDIALAETQVQLLTAEFPGSSRVGRIKGMLLEAKGEFSNALALYNDILKKDVANVSIMKRKVCIHKAQQQWREVIEAINEIVRKFPSDVASWQELGELYLSLCDYLAAVHCFEELVLLEPRNAHYHSRLAEALCSIGGSDRVLLARKHYTISLTIQGPRFNKRALYGLISCCSTLNAAYSHTTADAATATSDSATETGAKSAEAHEKKVNHELMTWAQGKLDELVEHERNVVGENGPIALVESILIVK
jgi:tetratricopeptide (TPR) repeat protein